MVSDRRRANRPYAAYPRDGGDRRRGIERRSGRDRRDGNGEPAA
jgi:hypothetical protein